MQSLKAGDRFLHFTIVRLLGEGGMGQVFEAEHEFTKRRTALKVALTKLADADMQERMIQEARALAELDHPNIVRLYDANVTPDGRLWLAMEFLEGRSLRAYRSTAGPLPVAQALHLLIEMCDGVAAAHEIGIIHRDLKPENVQITPQNVAKVLDFGAAKVTRGASTRSTIVGPGGKRIIGTPAYMSPEHLRGSRVDPRTDSYAIGTIGIELLWAHPFSNPDGTLPETYEMVRRQFVEPPNHLRDVAPHVPPGVADLLDRTLAKAPEDRPSVAEIAAGLRLERTKYKAANPDVDSAPFAKEWTGPGSWAANGPAVSLPRHVPAPVDPSRSVVVHGAAAPGGAEGAIAPPAPVPPPALVAPASPAFGPASLPAASVAATSAAPPSPPVIAGDAPRSHAPPAYLSTQDLAPSAQRPSVPHAAVTVDLRAPKAAAADAASPSAAVARPAATPLPVPQAMTVVPVTVGPEQRASHPAQVRARRATVLFFLAVCGVSVAALAYFFAAGAFHRGEGASSGTTVVVPTAPPPGDAQGDPPRATGAASNTAISAAGTTRHIATPTAPLATDPAPPSAPPPSSATNSGTTAGPAGAPSTTGPAKPKLPVPDKPQPSAAVPKGSGLDLPFATRPQQPN